MMLKPRPLTIRKGDPEQLSGDWEEYLYTFTVFLEATGQIPAHTNPELPNALCGACTKMKNFMILIGGAEVKMLFDHVGNVTDMDNWPDIGKGCGWDQKADKLGNGTVQADAKTTTKQQTFHQVVSQD